MAVSLAIYSHAFLIYGLIALALALVSWSLALYLKRLIGVPVGYVGMPKQ
jgi:hypothetical protein